MADLLRAGEEEGTVGEGEGRNIVGRGQTVYVLYYSDSDPSAGGDLEIFDDTWTDADGLVTMLESLPMDGGSGDFYARHLAEDDERKNGYQ